jgi:hypothetical protein
MGPPIPLEELPLPRRIAIARILTDALAGERDLAALYTAAARGPTTPRPLAAGFSELAQAKAARVAMLEGLVGAVAAGAPAPSNGLPASRADVFARAFQGERALEGGYRELGTLVGDAREVPWLQELAADAARHRDLVRHLYVRYS